MRKLIVPLIVFVAAAGGVAGGLAFKPKKEPCAEGDPCAEAEKEPAPAPEGASGYAELNRQFVIPILDQERVVALVVSSLAVEVAEGATETVFEREPKLRDAFLEVFFVHAHGGGFDGEFTSSRAIQELKDKLREAALPIMGAELRNVLITEIVRQEL